MSVRSFLAVFFGGLRFRGTVKDIAKSAIPQQEVTHTLQVYFTNFRARLNEVAVRANDILATSDQYIGVEIIIPTRQLSQQMAERVDPSTKPFVVAYVYREKLSQPMSLLGQLRVCLLESSDIEKLIGGINIFAKKNPVVEVSINVMDGEMINSPPIYWAKVVYMV